ncbi:titin homolog isoform X2 [Cyclopterus lumpus]|uniref:titin homolog isoform X2 n=1 Tax=Cyclopterus lumpus TaxID=8103 RepID=UPI00148642A5|nr:titin homolog isoform X2 [Cyclopterus lumpus]
MKFPVDLLANVSQAELERLSHNYMNNLLYSNPDCPDHLALSDFTQVTIDISSVGFVPLYGCGGEQKILALFSPSDPFIAVALYLMDRWWAVDDILKTADPTRGGAVEVKTMGEKIVLYILNRVVYRAKEMSPEELPFLCHGEKDHAKILWNDGEAAGFYSVKPAGSFCSSFSTRSYQLPVMDSIFVRRCQRGKGFGLQMLEDFVLSFQEDCLGLRYPISKFMYKVCEKYLCQYPGDTDLLWEVQSIGGPKQRTNIARKIQAMDQSVSRSLTFTEEALVITERTQKDVVITTQIKTAGSMECTVEIVEEVTVLSVSKVSDAAVPLTARGGSSGSKRRKMGEKIGEDKSEKVIRIEDIEAESPSEDQVSARQKTELHISELVKTEGMSSVAPEEQGEIMVDTAPDDAAKMLDHPNTILAHQDLEEADVTLAPTTEEPQLGDDAPQNLNSVSCDSQITVENVASEIEEDTAALAVSKEQEPSLSTCVTSENGEAGKTGRANVEAVTTVQSTTPRWRSTLPDTAATAVPKENEDEIVTDPSENEQNGEEVETSVIQNKTDVPDNEIDEPPAEAAGEEKADEQAAYKQVEEHHQVANDAVTVTVTMEEEQCAISEMCADREADTPGGDDAEGDLPVAEEEAPVVETRALRRKTKTSTATPRRKTTRSREQVDAQEAEQKDAVEVITGLESVPPTEVDERKAPEEDEIEVENEDLVTAEVESEEGTMTMTVEEEDTAGVTAAADELVQEETDAPLPSPPTDSAVLPPVEEEATPSAEEQQSEDMATQLSDLRRMSVVLVDLQKAHHDVQDEAAATEEGLPVRKTAAEAEEEAAKIQDPGEGRDEETAKEEEATRGNVEEQKLIVTETRTPRSGKQAVEATPRTRGRPRKGKVRKEAASVIQAEEPAVHVRVLRTGRKSVPITQRSTTKKTCKQLQEEEEGGAESTAVEAREEEEEQQMTNQEKEERLEERDATEQVENIEAEMALEKEDIVAEQGQDAMEDQSEGKSQTSAERQVEASSEEYDEGNSSLGAEEVELPSVAATRSLRSGGKMSKAPPKTRSRPSKTESDEEVEELEPPVVRIIPKRGRKSVRRSHKQLQKTEEGPEESVEEAEVQEEAAGPGLAEDPPTEVDERKAPEEDEIEVENEDLVTAEVESEEGTMTMTVEEEDTAGVTAAADELVQEETDAPLPSPPTDSAVLPPVEEEATPSAEEQQSEDMATQLSDLRRMTVVLVDLQKAHHDVQDEAAATEEGLPVRKTAAEAEEEAANHHDAQEDGQVDCTETVADEDTEASFEQHDHEVKTSVVAEEAVAKQDIVEGEQSTSTSEMAEGAQETMLTAKDEQANDASEEEAPVVERVRSSGEKALRATTKKPDDKQEEEAPGEKITEEVEPSLEIRVLRKGRKPAEAAPRRPSKIARTQYQTEEAGEEEATPAEEIEGEEEEAGPESPEEKGIEVEEMKKEEKAHNAAGEECTVGHAEQTKDASTAEAGVLEEEDNSVEAVYGIGTNTFLPTSVEVEEINTAVEEETTVVEQPTAAAEVGSDAAIAEEEALVENALVVAEEDTPAATKRAFRSKQKASPATPSPRSRRQKVDSPRRSVRKRTKVDYRENNVGERDETEANTDKEKEVPVASDEDQGANKSECSSNADEVGEAAGSSQEDEEFEQNTSEEEEEPIVIGKRVLRGRSVPSVIITPQSKSRCRSSKVSSEEKSPRSAQKRKSTEVTRKSKRLSRV